MVETKKEPVTIAISGAAGQIAYSLIFNIASGQMLGNDQPVNLHLLDIQPAEQMLKGVVMEIEDCAFPLVNKIVPTFSYEDAFQGADYAILVGAMPRKEGMLRKDLLKANVGIFKEQGKAIEKVAKKSIKVLVVGNPANTNCFVCAHYAPSIPRENFSALTRLDHNRAVGQLAKRVGVPVDSVKNVIIWGNHSNTQFPDVDHATVSKAGSTHKAREIVGDNEWLDKEFITTIQQRGGAVIAARKLSSAASAAKAITDHMRDWVLGTPEGQFVSMAVFSGEYDIPEGVIYSYPVTCKAGKFEIVKGLSVSQFARGMMTTTYDELKEEAQIASEFLG